MSLLCVLTGHTPRSLHAHNQGFDFTLCHDCGCELIREAGSDEWHEVPKGMEVVWRKFERASDAASVAARMSGNFPPPPPRRRPPRNGRPKPHRDRRGRPFSGAVSMLGSLMSLGRLVSDSEHREETEAPRAALSARYVILLPGAAR